MHWKCASFKFHSRFLFVSFYSRDFFPFPARGKLLDIISQLSPIQSIYEESNHSVTQCQVIGCSLSLVLRRDRVGGVKVPLLSVTGSPPPLPLIPLPDHPRRSRLGGTRGWH